MGYLIAAIVVLFLAAGFITYLVLNATKRGGGAEPDDPGADGSPHGIVAPDESPAGDTTEHAGEQRGGETVGGQDAERASQGHGAGPDRGPGDATPVHCPRAACVKPASATWRCVALHGLRAGVADARGVVRPAIGAGAATLRGALRILAADRLASALLAGVLRGVSGRRLVRGDHAVRAAVGARVVRLGAAPALRRVQDEVRDEAGREEQHDD
ncbi:MAG: hypothetical protein QOE28_2814, partial [Solirubrobacteraceae bacterium]|nr:hypothetical protein [Solirubrobacteraceae bacterium]